MHKLGVWHIITGSAIMVNRFLLTTVMTKIFSFYTWWPHFQYIYIPRMIHLYTSHSDCHTLHIILVWCYTYYKWIDWPKDGRITLYTWSNYDHQHISTYLNNVLYWLLNTLLDNSLLYLLVLPSINDLSLLFTIKK